MAEFKNVPAIRFKGFSEGWTQRRLGEICTIGDIDHRMPVSVTEGIPYVMTGDFIGLNDFDFKNAKLISIEDYEQLSKKIKPELGDVIMARYASVGAVRFVKTDIKFLVSYSCAILKLGQTNGSFVYHYLQSNYSQNQIESEINTGSQRNIGIDSLKKLLIRSPSENEQTKIGSYFQHLDKLISLHQAKVNKLTNLKKAMLEKMFPKAGADVPEIRFKGFEGAWEEKRLGDVSPIRGGFAFQSNQYFEHGIPIVKISNILPTGEVGGSFDFYSEQENDENYTLPNQSILLAMSGATTGKVSILNKKNNIKVYQNQRVGYFVNKGVVDYSFISTIVRSNLFTMKLWSVLIAGAQPNVSPKEIDSFEFSFPKEITEQRKIGEYFQKLDKTITLHQSELAKLNNLKKACLEKMFV